MEIIVSPLASVVENLDVDERLVRAAGAEGRSVLRLWWGSGPTVVIGRSENPEQVADLDACQSLGVEVVRRLSGGGTVLQTPDILNYSLTLPSPALPPIREVFALGARLLIGALGQLGLVAEARGISDVAVAERKISGNAMAKRWGGLLLHGTLICDLDLDLVDCCLRHPPREPDYRLHRSHRDFLTTLRAEGVVERSSIEAAVLASARRLAAEGSMSVLHLGRDSESPSMPTVDNR